MLKHFILTFGLLGILTSANAQKMMGIGTRWDDAFVEWIVYMEYEEDDGSLRLKWPLQENWTDWEYDVAGEYGNIRLQWKNDPYKWQIVGEGEIVSARTLWGDDTRTWRITNNDISLTLETTFGNSAEEWKLKGERHGHFRIFMDRRGDPRDWIIEDELDESVGFTMKMALVYIAIFNSIPVALGR